MNQNELITLFVYKDGKLYCRETGKLYAISIENDKEYMLYKQKKYCLSVLIYKYFMGGNNKYIYHIDNNLLNTKIENLYEKKNPVTEYNKLSYPQINTIEDLKEILKNNIFKGDGYPNQQAFSLKWWSKRNMPYVFSVIEKFKGEYNIKNNMQFVYHLFNDIKEIPLCEVCNKNHKVWQCYTTGYKTTCSMSCSQSQSSVINKRKKTTLERLGVEHASQSDFIKAKKKETCLKNYGVDNPSKCAEIQQKKIDTNLERYGEVHFCKTKEWRNIVCEEFPLLKDKKWLAEQHKTKSTVEIARELGTTATKVLFWIKTHDIPHIRYNIRVQQKELQDFLTELNYKYSVNNRLIIKPKELDILLDDKPIAFEMNGLYWHNEEQVGDFYHKEKYLLCKNIGIELLQFWDAEWDNKKEICKSILKSKLHLNQIIYARNCQVKSVSTKDTKKFLDENHIQGFCKSTVKLGLYYKDELISIITFGKPRFNKNYQWELIRFCNKLNMNVIGGASKLFKHFIKLYAPKNMISYCDLRLFNGELYKRLGFVQDKDSLPNYFYAKNGKVLSRYECQKKKLKNILKNYDEKLTEKENMFNEKWYIVYDCGNSVWKADF